MIHRASLFLSLVLLSTSACTSSAPIESHLGERLERFRYVTRWEVLAKAERHRIRERLRAAGKRVCEEGDWPQQWKEGRKACGCDIGDVRHCSLRDYGAAEWGEQQATQPAQVPSDGDGTESQMGKRLEKLTRRTMGELRAKAERHGIRESLRTAGARVCEEGDWPQEWWDGCKWCWCDVGEIRVCESSECDEELMDRLWQQHEDDVRETTSANSTE